jgi:hypothetical protein
VKSNDFEAKEIVSIGDAGGNLHILNASGSDLFDMRVVNAPRLLQTKRISTIPKRPSPFGCSIMCQPNTIKESLGFLETHSER